MSNHGTLEIELVDVYGDPVADTVDIHLRHRVLSDQERLTDVRAGRVLRIERLRAEPQGLYEVHIWPRSYLPVSRFVAIRATGPTRLTIPLPIHPDRVGRAEFPAYERLDGRLTRVLERSATVLGHVGRTGRDLYDALDPVNRAGLLNIAAKSLVTPFAGGADLLDHITLLDIRRDRCFAQVPPQLKDTVADAASGETFRAVSGGLHPPPAGFVPAGSFKTLDAYGNLQLTFFKNAESWVADVDIDDAAGLNHVFQVVRNSVTREPTHPYCIHEILVAHQRLDPGYRLVPLAG